MRRRYPTPARSRRSELTGPLDLLEFFGNEFVGGTLDVLEWGVEETAEHAGYLARRAGEKALRRIGRAVARRRREQ